MKKIISVILTVCMLLCCMSGCVKIPSAGSIDGEPISMDEFGYYFGNSVIELVYTAGVYSKDTFNALKINGKSALSVTTDRAFDRLIKARANNKMFEDLGLTPDEDTIKGIDEQMKAISDQYNGETGFNNVMKGSFITYNSFKEALLSSARADAVRQYLVGENGKTPVKEEDIEKYYKENYLNAKHILFSTAANAETGEAMSKEDKAAKKAKAEETLAKIRAGEPFEKFQSLSEDPGLAANPDGYAFTKDEFVPEFYDAVVNLKDNEVSDIVESEHGYHIIKRLPLDTSGPLFESKKAAVEAACEETVIDEALKPYIDAMKISKKNSAAKKIDIKSILGK